MNQKKRVRLFFDSNVLTAGIVSAWGLDKAVLSLCAARICRLVLAEAVREEVEENLLIRLGAPDSPESGRVLDDYARLIALMKPEIVSYPSVTDVIASRHLIRHAADVPVLLSAVASQTLHADRGKAHGSPDRHTGGVLRGTLEEYFR